MTVLRPAGATEPVVIAHRGNSSVAPQNTLAAFESAWRAGADAIELDVRLSRDGRVVVIHDSTVDDTTDGSGAVEQLDLATLRALDAGSWFSRAFVGQRVPTLDEVLALLVERPGTDVLLEVKGAWTPTEARRVTDAVDAAGLAERVVVQSFWPQTVEALRDAAEHLPRGLLLALPPDGPDELLRVCKELDVVTCNPAGTLLAADPGLLDRLRSMGLQVMVWTANEPAEWELLCEADVDAIITDRPDRLRGWLAGRR
ncbi:glycerophosphodiester phosphodiesterase [Oerskovia flava]|uniref:glycerophosphodiester phosphodiesterase n=1 Tax=Oerskovia flava TaxID=2986422 RepID=UPI00223FFDF9|nr:glycerophosphodiester phosphodiesterase family protein [Oerskovia sp. JB1-3-2]